MAQDHQLEFPPRPPTRTGIDRQEVRPDLARRDDKDELLAEIAAHTKALEGFFDERQYQIQEKSFLQKEAHLYQWQDPSLNIKRGEGKARLRLIERELGNDLSATERRTMEKEKLDLLDKLEPLGLRLDEKKEEQVAEAKKNRLRTSWVNSVLGRAQLMAEDFSAERLGVDCGFAEIASELEKLQARFKELVRDEKRIESELEDSADSDDPRVRLRLEVMRADLQDVYQQKKEFVTTELGQFKERCVQRLRDLRRRLLGEKLEV